MVTLLEGNLVNIFTPLFVFLLILVSSYAIISMTKIFGDHNGVVGIVSFVLAIAFATNDITTKTVAFATPWLLMLFVAVLFINIMFKFLGAEKETPLSFKEPVVVFFVFFFILLILILSAGQVLQQKKQAEKEAGQSIIESFPAKVGDIIRQPAVLGLVTVMLIATFTVMLLASHEAK